MDAAFQAINELKKEDTEFERYGSWDIWEYHRARNRPLFNPWQRYQQLPRARVDFGIACEEGDLDRAIQLSKSMLCSVNWKNPWDSYRTGLHLAALNGHRQIVEWLLPLPGTCADSEDAGHETPFELALKNGHRAIAEVFLKHDPGLRQLLPGLFRKACLNMEAKSATCLGRIGGFDPNEGDSLGRTAIWTAAHRSGLWFLEILLATGLPFDITRKVRGAPCDFDHATTAIEVAEETGEPENAALLRRYLEDPAGVSAELREKLGPRLPEDRQVVSP